MSEDVTEVEEVELGLGETAAMVERLEPWGVISATGGWERSAMSSVSLSSWALL